MSTFTGDWVTAYTTSTVAAGATPVATVTFAYLRVRHVNC